MLQDISVRVASVNLSNFDSFEVECGAFHCVSIEFQQLYWGVTEITKMGEDPGNSRPLAFRRTRICKIEMGSHGRGTEFFAARNAFLGPAGQLPVAHSLRKKTETALGLLDPWNIDDDHPEFAVPAGGLQLSGFGTNLVSRRAVVEASGN